MKPLSTEEKALAASAALIALANCIEKSAIPAMKDCVLSMRAMAYMGFELYRMGMIAKQSDTRPSPRDNKTEDNNVNIK